MARMKFPLALPCPRCTAQATLIMNTRLDVSFIVRDRHCRSCGHDFETYEIPADAVETLMNRAAAKERTAA